MSVDLSARTDCQTITNARVITPERVIDDGYVSLEEGRIAEVGTNPVRTSGKTIDVGGKLVLPGLIDLHGDEHEQYIHPRDGAQVDIPTALLSCDRANIAAGITTKFHAVAFENVPDGDRSISLAETVVDTIEASDELIADNRINARCEIGDKRSIEAVIRRVDTESIGLVSLMNHFPGCGQYRDLEQFNRRYAGEESSDIDTRRVETHRKNPSLSTGERRVINAGLDVGVTVASHDDKSEHRVEKLWKEGVSISEYPVTMAAAMRASQLGMNTVMGAPNVIRGESLWGNLSAREAIRENVVDVLSTDYHPASLLQTIADCRDRSLVERVSRLSQAPADAVGLRNRGRIEPGARGDLIVVTPTSPPQVNRVFIEGNEVYSVFVPRG